jgi:hypothetical protein
VIAAKLEAEPMVLHVPRVRHMPLSAAKNSCRLIPPARTASDSFHTSLPEPMSLPLKLPLADIAPHTKALRC